MMKSTSHILITRPVGQHQEFAHSLHALGMTVSHLPCLAIESLDCQELKSNLTQTADHVLFTSVNAVQHAHAQHPLPWPEVAVHAIGDATAQILIQLGQTLALPPAPPFNSEAWLTQINALPSARLLLLKGQGGRGLIEQTMIERGWQVHIADVYRRSCPLIAPSTVRQLLSAPSPDIVSVTSNEALDNLLLLAKDYLTQLRPLPLVVNSERAVKLARAKGFADSILVACPPGNQGQLTQIKAWLAER